VADGDLNNEIIDWNYRVVIETLKFMASNNKNWIGVNYVTLQISANTLIFL